MTPVTCRAITRLGQRCKARPLTGTDWCLMHSEDVSPEQRREWAARGGRHSAARIRARKQLPMEPLTADEVASYLSIGIRGVLAGSVAPPVLTAISNAARALAEVRRDGDVQARIDELEAALGLTRIRRSS
jgi:hypothetical protein